MRITGLVIALIGVAIAAFCGITAMLYKGSSHDDAAIIADRRPVPDLTVPLVIAGAALVAGGAMYIRGGEGYKKTNGPETPPAPAV